MEENKAHLHLEGLEKTFGDLKVLDGISLRIAEGEFITLLGASGCGKTTTIRIIAGLETPDAGRVLLDGEDITALPPEKRNVNTIFQNYALFPHMNVLDNVAYGLKIRKVPKADRYKKAEEMLSLVQLAGYGQRKVSELSGGQKQRVAIARAIINEPKVLLLDEPLGALDLKLRREMQLELKRMQKQLGITFIYITHDQEEAINMSDRIAVMHEGHFEQIGTPDEIYYRPRTSYVANFVGNANVLHFQDKTVAVRSENILLAEDMKSVDSAMETMQEADPGIRQDYKTYGSGEESCRSEVGRRTKGDSIEVESGADDKVVLSATVREKSFVGGQLRIEFILADGQHVTASRSGINSPLQAGEKTTIGYLRENEIPVEDNGI